MRGARWLRTMDDSADRAAGRALDALPENEKLSVRDAALLRHPITNILVRPTFVRARYGHASTHPYRYARTRERIVSVYAVGQWATVVTDLGTQDIPLREARTADEIARAMADPVRRRTGWMTEDMLRRPVWVECDARIVCAAIAAIRAVHGQFIPVEWSMGCAKYETEADLQWSAYDPR